MYQHTPISIDYNAIDDIGHLTLTNWIDIPTQLLVGERADNDVSLYYNIEERFCNWVTF